MALELRVHVRSCADRDERVCDVLRRMERAEWVRRVLRQVVPQLQRAAPVHVDALAALLRTSRRHATLSCAICMDDEALGPREHALQLPCGHRFHASCAQGWLRRSSTCPLCRFQLPGAYSGMYAVVAVHSTLLLRREAPRDALLDVFVGGHTLQVAVDITLRRVSTETEADMAMRTSRRALCRVSAAVELAGDNACAVPSTEPTRSSKRLRGAHAASADVAKRPRIAA